jgi:SAM-dependent methyltransferase
MWTTEFALRGYSDIFGADLTYRAIELTKKRLEFYGLNAMLSIQNAEMTSFKNASFDHVNCQGVIHHTPNTATCVKEIARILKNDGTGIISVYHENLFLKLWPFLRPIGLFLSYCGAKLKGRGRENIFRHSDVNEIVRLYDGSKNPIGKAYSKKSFVDLLSPYFDVDEIFYHFFPARCMPFKIPKSLHRFFDKKMGFMIFAAVRKKCVE